MKEKGGKQGEGAGLPAGVIVPGQELTDPASNGDGALGSETATIQDGVRHGVEQEGFDPIAALFDRVMATVPQDELDTLPADLCANLDHYLYGTPREK